MNIADFCIRNSTLTSVLAVLMIVGGLHAFNGMSRLEDPEFTIKDALVVTPYPGASAEEVEQEVTDELEKAIQQMGQVDEVVSKSDRGLSTITVTMKDKFDKNKLPQVWDELRRKVGDAQSDLPPGVIESTVIDDYGDVYGVFVAVYGQEYSYAELKKVIDMLRKELLLVQDVAKIETFGERQEVIYVELDRERMTQLGINPGQLTNSLKSKNLVVDTGRVRVGSEYIALQPTGTIRSIKDFENILISSEDEAQIYLKDIAEVRRGYKEPQQNMIRYDGQPAIGLGISTVSGGNVVVMGEALQQRAMELQDRIPLGIEVGIISLQSDAVTTAIKGFTGSLLQAVVIVVLVLLFFMGLRSGLLIGAILLVTIAGSFIFLAPWGVALERISLGALIIALGMLVDNAIVIVDGMLMKLQQGVDRRKAASQVVAQNAMPLLGGTLIAILAFAAIGTSQDSTGEFCRSLFQVVFVSLLLSWVTAVTIMPLFCVWFLDAPKPSASGDAYGGGFYAKYRSFLEFCIKRRRLTIFSVILVFASSLYSFKFVEQSFFPPSTRPQIMVDLWLPQGSHINTTRDTTAEVEQYLLELDEVAHVSSMIGQGALRFLLTYAPEKLNSAYAQLIVDVEPETDMDALIVQIEAHLADRFPDLLGYGSKFQLGPGSTGKIQARFSGPDANVLRDLAQQAEAILHADPVSKSVRSDWRQRVKVIKPVVAEEQANLNGITRMDVAEAIKENFDGVQTGVYRDGDLLLPIIFRAPEQRRSNVANLNNVQIYSNAAHKMIPLRQVVSEFETTWEDELLYRKDRKLTLTVFADPKTGPASNLFARVRPQIEAIELPQEYTLEWGGEYEDSAKAQSGLAAKLPVFILLMMVITVALFNSLRQPLIIWMCVPLALIGVTYGLLGTGQPFGFMALLGFLSLMGMLIKNAIVLIDQINIETAEGKPLYEAIVFSAISRLRPVSMAALTTALGMIPLLFDAFFSAMSVTIIFGLMCATVLTMVVVPVLYATIYRVKSA
ncbi:efflux RND transporter permease subunit [Agaribacterium haliotis]|uniref:efflux RND transporter permease subunit n=1 Tax=Agaribacterium haliotis TaxID=2013869 RepID=UPI000BB55C1B|nr:efflux RND transporter permease subunit [Agaribacterium haliotis]